ncbi:hypothetical protein CF8_0145 [Aeromonas phage CF8]|nr:hypothetical protein CF8_0145 [Aeromonas phage CF8]
MKLDNFSIAQLKEFGLKAQTDIVVIKETILDNKDQYAGCESHSDEGQRLVRVAEYIKETYNEEVSPDIAGMEGFIEKLQAGWGKIKELLKSKTKNPKVSGHIGKTKKEILLYATDGWLNQMTFKNVGSAKFKIPAIFKEVNTPDGVEKIIAGFLKQVKTEFQQHQQNSTQRLSAGLKIFNQFDKIKIPDTLSKEDFDKHQSELAKYFPIKPEKKPDIEQADIIKLLDLNTVDGAIPVLNKDGVKAAVKVMTSLCDMVSDLEMKIFDVMEKGIDYDDRDGSDFWYRMHERGSEYEKELFKAINWEATTDSLTEIEMAFEKQVIKILKFMEWWILFSIK